MLFDTSTVQGRSMAGNRIEYGERYGALRFVTPDEAVRFMGIRATMLQRLGAAATACAGGTKIHSGPLSPGCAACVAGEWSCLFINGLCNAECFYCPTAQDDDGPPTTNGIPFTDPHSYADYLDRFGFRGASMSGGEPLLSLDKAVALVRAVKERFGDAMHIWLYTNGILLTDEAAAQLADSGLDEIRIDIGATGYRLDAVRRAVNVIPVVTVEIPAVPEEVGQMQGVMGDMVKLGVNHLNLHQLRLTPHNFDRLVHRGYTFIHGEKVTVVESELAAIQLAGHGAQVGLPVNYCSFVYKNRYQGRAARMRGMAEMMKDGETATEAGFIRSIQADGGSRYAATRLLPGVSYRHPFVKIPIGGMDIVVERMAVSPVMADDDPGRSVFEEMTPGLADYY